MGARSHVLPCLCAICLPGLALGAPAHAEEFEQHGVHEHGHVTLNVAVEGNQLVIELDAPAVNVVGFEHAPRTDEERRAVRDASLLLRSGRRLFGVSPRARCRVLNVEIREPHSAQPEKGHEGHGDYEARFNYECADPAMLTWLEPWLLAKLRNVSEARVNVVTPSGQRSESVTDAKARVMLGP